MRKSLALALVLVFVITGAAFAATPSFSGNISVEAESKSFTGPFTIEPSVRTDMDIAEKGETWQVDVRVRATWDPTEKDSVDIAINRYRGIFNGEGFTATIARNYDLGNIDTPFAAIRQVGNPSVRQGDQSIPVDQIRVSADLGGIAIATQLVSDNELKVRELKVRAQTSVDNFTIGAGAELKLDGQGDLEKSNYAGYVTTSFGDLISSAQVLFGSFDDTFKTAVGATIKLTEQLSVDVRYATEDVSSAAKKGYYVGGTFTEGLLQAKASIAEKDTEISASFVYRGSENNVAFDDLFSNNRWADNVAPAFGVFYTSKESAADPTIELKGVFPTADNFVARASITLEGSKNDISAEAKLGLTEKVTLRPYFSNDKNDQSTYGLDVEYAISDNSSITVTAQRSDKEDGDLLKVVYSIDF